MKRLLMLLAVLVAFGSVAQANPTPFLTITDGSYGVRNTSYTIEIYQYGMNPGWKNVYLSAQGLTSQQVANSNWPWMQGLLNDWYCVDLNSFQGSSNWGFYDTAVVTDPWGDPAGTYGTIDGLKRAAWMIDQYHDTARSSAANRAALQLAVWEAVYDNGADFDYTDGVFKTQNFTDSGIITQAETWFDSSYWERGRGVYAVDGQNMLGRTDIPEPATLILLGLGLAAAGVGAVRRRKKP